MLADGPRPIYASGECEIDFARRAFRLLGSPIPLGGRALQRQRKPEEARDVLVPVYDRFTEGFVASKVRRARRLLGELT
jgi:hypothetical protein